MGAANACIRSEPDAEADNYNSITVSILPRRASLATTKADCEPTTLAPRERVLGGLAGTKKGKETSLCREETRSQIVDVASEEDVRCA